MKEKKQKIKNEEKHLANFEFVFLHAYGDSMKDAFWSWIKPEIIKEGGKIGFDLDLPNTNSPKYAEQSAFVLKNYKFNDKTIVIAHSLGNILIMNLLKNIKNKIKAIIMVAPPLPTKEGIISGKAFIDNKSRPKLAEYCDWNFDFNEIGKKVEKIVILADKKDHIVPITQPREIAKRLEAEILEVIGEKSHFSGEKEPEVLKASLNLFSKKEMKTENNNEDKVDFATTHKSKISGATKSYAPSAEVNVDFASIEKKWQKEWEDKKIFAVKEDSKKKKYYVLEMYPYPSASFLHMGHVRNFTIGDVFARFKRMSGFNVLYPMGYDSFGLPAETAAKKQGIHPRIYTEEAIKKITEYFRALGNSYDWSRTLASHEPEYYKWNQYFFLKFFEKGLAYRKKAPVNWCENCQSVLANEEAEGGKCWRCDNEVSQKEMNQWFFKITDYADRLLEDLDKIDWHEKIKTMQRNWIGKSYGTEVHFKINNGVWPVFTTRVDTVYGVTFMVISANHPRLFEIVTKDKKKQVEEFVKKCQKAKSPEEIESLDKEGVFTGSYAINPVTNEKIPVWAGNFVLADYGSGMVMAVPTHDQRDFDFAKKYNIPMKQVIAPLFNNTFEKDAIRKDKKTEVRDSVFIIVKHWKEEKYFCLDWKEHKWKSFLLGGIEKGENAEKAAIREVKEETGYQDIKSISKIGMEVHAQFYAGHKDVNRYGKYNIFVAELKSDKYQKPSEEETKNHEGFWLEKDKVLNFLNLENHKYAWDIYLNGEKAFTENGVLINSDKFSGIESKKAIEEITKYLESKKFGRKTINYKIKDWMISRQRYWGTLIPVIYCDKCGVVAVPENQIPVMLPEKVDFKTAGNPLATNKDFVNTKCPKCRGNAKRETDTMGGFVDSSWYFLRYCDNKNKSKAFDEKKVNYWMPVDQYIGGAEHAVMHLIYARFFIKALKDLGFVNFDEPFSKLFNQGIVYKDGAKMSKSKGNVVFQTDISNKYGIDTARLFLMVVSSPDKQMEWSDEGVEGSFRMINKLIRLSDKITKETTPLQEHKINKTIKNVTLNIESFEYPKTIISIVECIDSFSENISKKNYEIILKLISPFCPHIAEEIWHKIGNKTFISLESWPVCDESKIDDELEKKEEQISKLILDINNIMKILENRNELNDKKAIKIFVIPKELELYTENKKKLQKSFNLSLEIFSVKEASEKAAGKIIKASPGKPGILFE